LAGLIFLLDAFGMRASHNPREFVFAEFAAPLNLRGAEKAGFEHWDNEPGLECC